MRGGTKKIFEKKLKTIFQMTIKAASFINKKKGGGGIILIFRNCTSSIMCDSQAK